MNSHEHLAELRRKLNGFEVRFERDAIQYKQLLDQLPADERTVYMWFGLSQHPVFELPNVAGRLTREFLDCLSEIIGGPVGLWPELPYSTQLGMGSLPMDACYHERFVDAFSGWSNPNDQETLRSTAGKFGESWRLTLLCSAQVDQGVIASLVPREWYAESRGTIFAHEILSVLADVAEAVGWVGYEFFAEPRRCIVFFAHHNGSLCSQMRHALPARGLESNSISLEGGQVLLLADHSTWYKNFANRKPLAAMVQDRDESS